MANLGQTYNVNDLPENDNDFMALPAGDYPVTITEATLHKTKSGSGEYIKLRMDITGDSHQGRVIFANLNIRNASETAERIGLQQLGDVLRAIGLPKITDTDQLVGGYMIVKLKIKDDEQYGDENGKSNEVAAFKAIKGSKAPKAGAAPAAAGSKPPWVA